MKMENLTNSAVSVTGTVLGAMASRVVAEKLPIKKSKVKHGVLALVGIVGASFLDRKDATSAFVQDMAIGVSATQLGALAKDFLAKEEKSTLQTALGSPMTDVDAIDFLASHNNYDFIPSGEEFEEIDLEYEEEPIYESTGFRL